MAPLRRRNGGDASLAAERNAAAAAMLLYPRNRRPTARRLPVWRGRGNQRLIENAVNGEMRRAEMSLT